MSSFLFIDGEAEVVDSEIIDNSNEDPLINEEDQNNSNTDNDLTLF